MKPKTFMHLLLTLSLTMVSCGGCGGSDYSSSNYDSFQRRAPDLRPACSEDDKQAIIARIGDTVAYPERFVNEVQSKKSAYRELLGCIEHLRIKTLNRALQMGESDAAHNTEYNEMLMEHGLDPRGSGPFTGGAQNFHCSQEFLNLSTAITRVANGEGSSALRSIYVEQFQMLQLADFYRQMGFDLVRLMYSLRIESAKLCMF